MNPILTIRVPEELRTTLKGLAFGRGYTVNGLILSILWDWVKANTVSEEEKCASK